MSFELDIQAWAEKVRRRTVDVYRLSAVAVATDVRVPKRQGGNMPVRKGNLRNSLEASLNGVVPADVELGPDDMLTDPEARIISTVESSQLGQVLSLGFRVTYAPEQERKNAFVRLTAQRWPQIVDYAVIAAKERIP